MTSPPLVLEKACARCGETFAPTSNRQKFCSQDCRSRYRFGEGDCVHCGKHFRATYAQQRYCSLECWYADPKKREYPERVCGQCAKDFQPETATQQFCSVACAGMAKRKPREITNCQTCGKEIDWRKPRKTRFCSKACAMTGRVRKGQKPAFRYIDANGYVRVKIDGKWQLEHRVVMAKRLGRPLTRRDTVHHLNGQRADNRDENLEHRIGGHGPGASKPHCPTCTCFAH